MRKAHNELLEVDLPIAIVVKDVDHPPGFRHIRAFQDTGCFFFFTGSPLKSLCMENLDESMST